MWNIIERFYACVTYLTWSPNYCNEPTMLPCPVKHLLLNFWGVKRGTIFNSLHLYQSRSTPGISLEIILSVRAGRGGNEKILVTALKIIRKPNRGGVPMMHDAVNYPFWHEALPHRGLRFAFHKLSVSQEHTNRESEVAIQLSSWNSNYICSHVY